MIDSVGKQRAFTLLELIVVMLIVAISVGILGPRFTGNELSRLKSQVREVVSILNYARRMAIVSGQTQTVWLQVPSDEEATAESTEAPQHSSKTRWISRGASLQWDEEDGAPQAEDNAYKLEFYPGGGTNGRTFLLKQGEFTMKIEVHPLTGKTAVVVDE